ncbi:MAG: hypothetical protein IPP32_09320 [Bacteroidetes bacterium]|nr:hypothetical protein [Bacteroidota bacterium]
MKKILLLGFLFSAFSCNYFKPKQKEKAIARVFDKFLDASDIEKIVPQNVKGKDSIAMVKNYIDNWVRQNLLLQKAEQNLNAEVLNASIEKQLQDYRTSLITFAYEKELIRQKLDTGVSESEIEAYYSKNPQNFQLKNNIIKVLYVKVKKNAPKLNKVREWCKSEKPQDKKLLEDYCYQFAENFYLDDTSWFLFDDLLKEIPIEAYDKEQFLQNNRWVEVNDTSSLYFVNIKGFKIKDSTSPLSFEKQNIHNIILNKRKLQLINQMKEDVYNTELKNKNFEIY